MSEVIISQQFRLKKKYMKKEIIYLKINQIELMSKKHKKVYRVLNYIDHLFTVISTITGCVSISVFASLVAIPKGITSSAIRLKICQ